MDKRTPYQLGYEDALDRGWMASRAFVKPESLDEYNRGFTDGDRSKKTVNACAGMADPAAEIERLRSDTVILADTIRRLLEAQPLGTLWRQIIPAMHPELRGAVERAEALPQRQPEDARAAKEVGE